jgi:hypothetical protein
MVALGYGGIVWLHWCCSISFCSVGIISIDILWIWMSGVLFLEWLLWMVELVYWLAIEVMVEQY